MMQRISKHFYLEEVFDDSTPHPRLRWRYRNFFFGDSIDLYQGTHDVSQDVSHNATSSNLDSKKTGFRSERIPVSALSFIFITFFSVLSCI